MFSADGLSKSQEKMRDAGVPQIAIDVFSRFYNVVASGQESFIREADVEPLVEVSLLSQVLDGDDSPSSTEAIKKTAFVKLNGGLGTSMGMAHAKSLLQVRDGLTFLDVIASQVMHARSTYDAQIPLILMNSFHTNDDSIEALKRYPDLKLPGLPLAMMQNQEPKLVLDTLEPVEYPEDPSLEWCPPGHGDVYTVLQTSGVLDALLSSGYEYLNISNVDNLGAYPSAEIAQWFAESGAPFAAETVERTPADRKGGHVVVRDGQLILRETAQTHVEDESAAANIERHKYFNANTLWIRLESLKALLAEHAGVLPLPLIQNRKTVDPAKPSSTPVVQLEFAMGAAIELFDGAQALVIDRSRFLPVKTTNDLLLLRSDVYTLTDEYRLIAVSNEPLVTLDKSVYAFIEPFEERFAQGVPHLAGSSSFTVTGDWAFEQDVRVEGNGVLQADDSIARVVARGSVISSDGIVSQ